MIQKHVAGLVKFKLLLLVWPGQSYPAKCIIDRLLLVWPGQSYPAKCMIDRLKLKVVVSEVSFP